MQLLADYTAQLASALKLPADQAQELMDRVAPVLALNTGMDWLQYSSQVSTRKDCLGSSDIEAGVAGQVFACRFSNPTGSGVNAVIWDLRLAEEDYCYLSQAGGSAALANAGREDLLDGRYFTFLSTPAPACTITSATRVAALTAGVLTVQKNGGPGLLNGLPIIVPEGQQFFVEASTLNSQNFAYWAWSEYRSAA